MSVQRAVILACWPAADPLLAGFGVDPALFEVAGKSTVQRVVEQAVALGARRIDVVLGDDVAAYRACLGDGERWGSAIAYHYAPVDDVIPQPLARQLAGEPDCLLLRADAMLPPGHRPEPATFGCHRANDAMAWSGWARLPGNALLAAAPRAASAKVMAEALSADPRVQPQFGEPGPAAACATTLLATACALLRSPDYPIGIALRPAREGLWIGNGARIHPTARVIAPAYLGENVLVGANAVVGPDAVIGARSVVDRGATVAHGLVAPDSYVGACVELRHAILSGRNLVNVGMGVRLDIADRELAGSATASDGPLGPGLAERLLAASLWVAAWPLRALLPGTAKSSDEAVDLGVTSNECLTAIQQRTPGAWLDHFRAVLHPGLAQVVRGRRRIVGPLPSLPDEPAEPVGLRRWTVDSTLPGLINDVFFLGPDGADPAMRFATDALATTNLHIVHIAGAVLRYAGAVLADWRSLRPLPGQAVPDNPRRAPAQAVPMLSRDA